MGSSGSGAARHCKASLVNPLLHSGPTILPLPQLLYPNTKPCCDTLQHPPRREARFWPDASGKELSPRPCPLELVPKFLLAAFFPLKPEETTDLSLEKPSPGRAEGAAPRESGGPSIWPGETSSIAPGRGLSSGAGGVSPPRSFGSNPNSGSG